MAGRNRAAPIVLPAAGRPRPDAGRLTRRAARHYSFAMPAESPRPAASTIDLELRRLEKRVEELLATVQTLKDENRALRQRQEMLANEKTTLLHRNEQVRTRVEAMIGRLKSMEHGA
jgi:cell division protein ZapB